MKLEAKFKNIGKLVRERREKLGLSQTELCVALGFSKNGQNISNVERGLASLPIKHIARVSIVLQTPAHLFKEAILKDYEEQIEKAIKGMSPPPLPDFLKGLGEI